MTSCACALRDAASLSAHAKQQAKAHSHTEQRRAQSTRERMRLQLNMYAAFAHALAAEYVRCIASKFKLLSHAQHTNFQVHVELAKVCYLLKDENKAVEHLANHLKHNVAIGRTLCTGCGKTRGSFLCDRLETSSHVSVDSCVTCPVPVLEVHLT